MQTGTLSRWADSPIVHHALQRHPNLDPLSILLTMSDTMHALEERFPGLPFAEIFSLAHLDPADPPSFKRNVGALRGAGLSEEEIFGLSVGEPTVFAGKLKVLSVSEMIDARDGMSLTDLQKKYGAYRGQLLSQIRRREDTAKEREALRLLDQGHNVSEIKALGVSHPTTRKAFLKRFYRRWLAEEGQS
jgi:hypothetical protein